MATPNVGILTNAGKNLIDRVNAGQTKISFSKIVFSSMSNNQLTDDQIKALTTVAPQEIVVNNPEVTLDNNTGETRIRATGNNKALNDGVYVKTYAVYAKDDSGNEILYGLTVSPNPNYLPEYDGVTPQAVTYSYKVNISNTSNITFSNSNDIYVSNTDLDEALEPYAKTVDVNQQLDKKVNVADMRKPANDVAGIDEVNQQLDNKVADNKDGTEQLNGVQVQPFNKLSDTIGGRNLATNLGDVLTTPPVNGSWSKTAIGKVTPEFFKIINRGTTQPITISFEINTPDDPTKTNHFDRVDIDGGAWGSDAVIGTNYFSVLGFKWLQIGNDIWKGTYALQYNQGSGVADSNKPNIILVQAASNTTHRNFTVLGNSLCLYWGTQAPDWTPAPEDKQDKIAYTPADDSKVVHSTDMRKPASDVVGLEDITTACNQGGIANRTDVHSITKEGLYQLNGSSLINFINSGQWWGTIQVINQGGAILQIARVAQGDIYTNSYAGSPAHWIGWTKLADDSKVAHLSGANNFDTVPTVKNNPLLLASSLPSDLARTGSNQEFTGKNTFDTAPIDKTTGNPYITKDGVPSIPSDVARTGQDANFTAKLQQKGQDVALANNTISRNPDTGSVSSANTFTAAQTFSIAPVINDASRAKGDNQAATMADLKSVKESAWRQLDRSHITINYDTNSHTDCLYRIDPVTKRIYINWIINCEISGFPDNMDAHLDFSSVVSKFTSQGPGAMLHQYSGLSQAARYAFSISGSEISFTNNMWAFIMASDVDVSWFGYDTLLI